MVNRILIDEWIHKADEDFGFAKSNMEDKSNNYYAQICFFFEQAVEKYLKAYIVAHELEFKKIHDLTILLQICEGQNSEFSSLSDECNFLTDFYIETRYPVHWPTNFTREIAERAYTSAEKIKNFVKEKIDQ